MTWSSSGGYDTEMAALRREGLTRPLPADDVERLFTLGFALDQLRQHFKNLARCVAEFFAVGPRLNQDDSREFEPIAMAKRCTACRPNRTR